MQCYTKSLRWNIQFWQLLVLFFVVVSLLVGFFFYEKKHRIARTEMQLAQLREPLFVKHIVLKTLSDQRKARHQRLPKEIRQARRELRAQWRQEDLAAGRKEQVQFDEYGHDFPPLESDRELFTVEHVYAKVWDSEGRALYEGGAKAASIPYPKENLAQHGHFYRWRNGSRELVFVGPRQEVIVIGKCGSRIYQDLHHFALTLVGVGCGVVLVAWFVGWLASRKIVQPIDEVCQVAKRISNGNLDERVPTLCGINEFDGLIGVLNQTFEKLGKSVDNQVRFTADASHELRTPLTIILNEVQWLLERQRDVEQYMEGAAVCEKAAQHMRELIEDLLELARFDAGEYELRKRDFEAVDLVDEVFSLLLFVAEKKGVELQNLCADVALLADYPKMKQVLLNLVSNGISHTPAGGKVTVAGSREGDRVTLTVEDTGCGMPPEVQAQVFERFYRGDKQLCRENGGTGLGLAISEAIVKAHGGEIVVRSSLGNGSSFSVSLPL